MRDGGRLLALLGGRKKEHDHTCIIHEVVSSSCGGAGKHYQTKMEPREYWHRGSVLALMARNIRVVPHFYYHYHFFFTNGCEDALETLSNECTVARVLVRINRYLRGRLQNSSTLGNIAQALFYRLLPYFYLRSLGNAEHIAAAQSTLRRELTDRTRGMQRQTLTSGTLEFAVSFPKSHIKDAFLPRQGTQNFTKQRDKAMQQLLF